MILRKADSSTKVVGKEVLPRAGEYTGQVLERALETFLRRHAPAMLDVPATAPGASRGHAPRAGRRASRPRKFRRFREYLPIRPAGFCTGCPERPIFTAMKLLQRELGSLHISCDIGCHLFSILPPFNLGNTTMGYGLGAAGAAAFNSPRGKRAIAVMGDGGFWHNGLTSGVGNAVFNQTDNVLVIVDNGYAAATGGQDVLSSRADNRTQEHQAPHCGGGAGRRRQVAARDRSHLRLEAHAGYAARGDDDARKGTEGHRGGFGVHAQPAAARASTAESCDRGRRARGARRASASMPTPAPAITRASVYRAVRR